eukprot:Clim_evm3s14 gene=Clim_evmTU3s14
MKPGFVFKLGAFVSMANACVKQDGLCTDGSQYCDYNSCIFALDADTDEYVGTCHESTVRRMNAPCDSDRSCWSNLCEKGYCAPPPDKNQNGVLCNFDESCNGGWCLPNENSREHPVCNDRTLDIIDPAKWSGCVPVEGHCTSGSNCCDFFGYLYAEDSDGGYTGYCTRNLLDPEFRRVNFPCDSSSQCFTNRCIDGYCANNTAVKGKTGEPCAYDAMCNLGWCRPAADKPVCDDRTQDLLILQSGNKANLSLYTQW